MLWFDGSLELSPVVQQAYPRPERFQPWETCMTMGRNWAYNPDENNWKTPRELLQNLVSVASRGGNYLLNVGPTDKGNFPLETLERLAFIGTWMARNSESIHGTTYMPLPYQTWGHATRKDASVFLHVFNWPDEGSLVVQGFPTAAKAVSTMSGTNLSYMQEGTKLKVSIPVEAPDPDVSVPVVSVDALGPAWREFPIESESGIEPEKYYKRMSFASGSSKPSPSINASG